MGRATHTLSLRKPIQLTDQLTSNSSGFIPEILVQTVIEPLTAKSVVLQQNPRVFDSSQPLRVPRIGQATVGWYAEGATTNIDNVAVDEVDLLPSTLESLRSLTVVSKQLLRSATVGVSEVLSARISTDIALAIDNAFLTGSGTAGTNVIGLINQPGITSATYAAAGSGGTIVAGSLQDTDLWLSTIGAFTAAHLNLATSTFVIHPTDLYATGGILQAKDTLGRGLFQPSPSAGNPGSIYGVPVVTTTQTTQGTILLVDWSQILVVRDLAPSVDVLTELFAQQSAIGIAVETRWDIQLAHPQAVTALTAAA
jgi:HK97 family phage major capsid protein